MHLISPQLSHKIRPNMQKYSPMEIARERDLNLAGNQYPSAPVLSIIQVGAYRVTTYII